MEKTTYCQYQKFIRKGAWDKFSKKHGIPDIIISLVAAVFVGFIWRVVFKRGIESMLIALAVLGVCFLIYSVCYFVYRAREYVVVYNNQREKIDILSPAKPDIGFIFSEFPQIKGRQKLTIVNLSPKEITCHAVFTYIAPMIFKGFIKYPPEWYSKNLVWSNKKTPDGNIVIDGNSGNAILDIAETSDDRFNFLFQNGESVQVGFDLDDEYKKDTGLPENAYLVNLRLDGKFEGKDFVVEKKYFVLFKVEKIDSEKNITMPIFRLQEAFE